MHTLVGRLSFFGGSAAVAAFGALGIQDSGSATGSTPAETPATQAAAATAPQPGNVLLLLLDDIGAEMLGCCPESSPDTKTPRIDAFAKSGVRFDNLWSNPACSPTRATILTGRYGFRTGIGAVIHKKDPSTELAPGEVCLPEALHKVAPDCRTALLGKWHLGVNQLGIDAPRAQGFEVFRGTVDNLPGNGPEDGFFSYEEVLDGEFAQREAYATTATVDDTLAAIEGFGDDPWFVMASFHVAHRPHHAPPDNLHSRKLSGKPRNSAYEHVAAMVEAFDTEFGRMLDALPEAVAKNTTIIVLSDNGSPTWARIGKAGGRGGKGSLFEGGIRVPMIVGGAGVVDGGRVESHPINTTDLFATVLSICRGSFDREVDLEDAVKRDSVSFAPYLASKSAPARREWIMAERFKKNDNPSGLGGVDRVAIKLGTYKRVEDAISGQIRLYDLEEDPGEHKNLLRDGVERSEAALAALARMESILSEELKRKL